MYSPKIDEVLIPRIYRAAKEAKLPMTAWVNRAVLRALPEAAAIQPNPQPGHPSVVNAIDFTIGRTPGEREAANGEH